MRHELDGVGSGAELVGRRRGACELKVTVSEELREC